MKKLPFGLTPDTDFFCALETHIDALNVLNFSLNSGEALIKVVGEVGTGKTMLCRLLLNQLENNRFVAYIPYPKLTTKELKFSLAKELGLRISANSREDQLTQRIQTRLLKINKSKGPVVLLIDEAQLIDEEGLELLRLFTNLETEHQKLIQIVLFGQPELDKLLAKKSLRQIKQRIVFSYQLKPLNRQQIYAYVKLRLSIVSNAQNTSFGWFANWILCFYSKGIPRLVNILCHKALLLSYGQQKQSISVANLIRSAKDTESISTKIQDNLKLVILLTTLLGSSSAMALWKLL